MNLLQAIEQAGDNWFRPIGITHEAYFRRGPHIYMSAEDGSVKPRMTFMVELLTGEWEIVTPEQVINERK